MSKNAIIGIIIGIMALVIVAILLTSPEVEIDEPLPDDPVIPEEPEDPIEEDMMEAEVYFYLPEDETEVIYPVIREFPVPQDIKAYALNELLEGPTDQEKEEGYFTAIDEETTLNFPVYSEDGVTYASFSKEAEEFSLEAKEQIEKTLFQFPQVEEVVITIE